VGQIDRPTKGLSFFEGPKQPTLTVGNLVDNAYELQRFHPGDRLRSQTLPNLNLSIDAIFEAAGPIEASIDLTIDPP
jgi:Uma2 family endonuclease